MLWLMSVATVCGRGVGEDFPTALHAMLRQDGKLCSFLKLYDDTSCITHGACKDNDRNLQKCSRVWRSRELFSKAPGLSGIGLCILRSHAFGCCH